MGWTALLGTATSSACVPSRCSPRISTRPLWARPGLITTRSSVPASTPAPSAPRIRGFGHRGQPLPHPDVEVVERGRPELDEHLAGRRHGIGDILVAEHLGPALLVDPDRLHAMLRILSAVRMRAMTTAEVQRLGAELGLDAVGRCPRPSRTRAPSAHIRERRARGLFGALRFTTSRPEVSCHPERLLDGARSVVSAALCYWLPEPERAPGHGRLPRYAWHDGYAELREKLDALGRALGAPYRVLVDANQHVDREAAARSGRRLLRQEHDADHRAARLVGRSRHARHRGGARADAADATPDAARAPAASTRARRARSTSRACSTRRRASPTGRRSRARSPSATARRSARRSTAATSARTSARGTAASRGAGPRSPRTAPPTSTSSRGSARSSASTRTCSRGSTCRGTIRAGCGETRSSRSGTPVPTSPRRARC